MKFIPSELDFFEGSLWLASEMERDQIDVAIFQGGVASPMMWVASRLSQIPNKIDLCVGVNMYQAGQTATVYMSNPTNLEKEKTFWRSEWGRQLFIPGGVDIEEAVSTPSLSREAYSIDPDAVTFGILSNYPGHRATPQYMECVAEILRTCPKAVFVCMGPGDVTVQSQFMESQGLLDRCRWLSWQHTNSFASLTLLDFYFNEFPLGGAQSLLEALACGIPATAIRWSDNYAESAGAEIAGAGFAVMERDLKAYVARAVKWALDPVARSRAAEAQLASAKNVYSAEKFIRELCALSLELSDKT